MLHVVGLDGTASLPGVSLSRCWGDGEGVGSPVAASVDAIPNRQDPPPVDHGDIRSIVVDGFQYIRNGDGSEEVYDLASDWAEERDLVETDAGRGRLPALRAALDEVLAGVR